MDVLVQIDAWDPAAQAPVTLRAGSRDTPEVCHALDATWWPSIAKLPALRYDFFDGAFGNQITAPSSSLTIQTEPWPKLGGYSLPDARFKLWTRSAAEWVLRFDGRVTEQPEIADGAADIQFAVDDRWLDKALLATYAGTTGAEGPVAMAGQIKPMALGAPRYVPGQLIDSVNSVFQVTSYGPLRAFDAALDRLVRFGSPVADYPTYDALVAATIAPGEWATAKAVGMARFGAPPAGKISFLVQGEVSQSGAWARRPGQLIRRIAALAGGLDKIDSASLDALDAARPYNLSLYLDAQTTAREIIQRVAASVNAVAVTSWLGKLHVLPVAIGSPTMTLAADGSSLPPVSGVKQIGIASPWQRLSIGAERTWAVHALSDIAFAAELIPMGVFKPETTYREGNIVSLEDGSTWLYVATTPGAGHAPPKDAQPDPAGNVFDAWWFRQAPPTVASSVPWSGVIDDDGNKPEDGATVGAPPGTNIGTRPVEEVLSDLDDAAETARRAAEAARLLDAAVDATDAEVADVQASLATARSEVAAVRTDASKALTDLSAEVLRAKDAEGTLTTKVESAQRTADGAASDITTETIQRTNADSGLAARTFTLETGFTRGSIGIDTPDRAAFSATASGAPEGLANTAQATTTNATICLSWVLTVAQGGPLYHKALAPVRPGRTWKQEVTAIRAAAGTAANMRTVTVILDASYAVLATINGSSTGVLATPTTLTNTQVCDTILANYPTAAFIRFGFGRSANANSHVSRSVVTDATEALAVRALIASEEAARTTNDSAIALRVDSIDTTVQGNTTAIRDETVARSDGDGALGRRIDSVVAQATTDRGDYTAKVENEVAARSGGDSALAGRTSAVEAQLAGTQSSGLLAKIGDETIARVDGVSAVAARTATLETGFSRVPQTWMVKAKGASATTPSGFGDAGVFAPDGTRYGIASRSYTVVVFTAGANTVETTRAFDVYANGSTNGPVAMATFLNGLAAGKTVIIYTADEPRNARLTDVLVAAMRRCGAGERYESSDFRDRSAYILIGRVGVGRGGGIEYYAGSVDNDTAAWLEVPFTLVSGRAEVGSQGGISSTATRLAEETVSRSTGDSALASRTGAVEATVNTGPNSNASLRGAVNDVATASANGLSALAQRTGGVEARAGSLESRTGIVETAVADSKNKLAAARLEISATSPGGRVSMAFKSDTYSGASIDIEGDATWKGKIDVRSVTSTGSLLMSNQAVKVFDATRIRVQLGNLDV